MKQKTTVTYLQSNTSHLHGKYVTNAAFFQLRFENKIHVSHILDILGLFGKCYVLVNNIFNNRIQAHISFRIYLSLSDPENTNHEYKLYYSIIFYYFIIDCKMRKS